MYTSSQGSRQAPQSPAPNLINPTLIGVTSAILGLAIGVSAAAKAMKAKPIQKMEKGWPKGIRKSINSILAFLIVTPFATTMVNGLGMKAYTTTPLAPQNPHKVIIKDGIPVKINEEMSELQQEKLQPTSALQLKIGCSATAIKKTSSAVLAVTAKHCVPNGFIRDEYGLETVLDNYDGFLGQDVSTADNVYVGKITQVFQPHAEDVNRKPDMALVLITSTPDVVSKITPMPVATPENAQMLLKNDLVMMGFPGQDAFVDGKSNTNLHLNPSKAVPWMACMFKNNYDNSLCYQEAGSWINISRNIIAIESRAFNGAMNYGLQGSLKGRAIALGILFL
jgi:hypothetical protein